ncbi:MAG: ATP-binding protein [Halanaerobiaceae bacterium]
MKDLSLHILDIVQNSLAAGAQSIEISICENSQDNLLVIEISDNGKGMSSTEAENSLDPFVTSRKTREVGLGLSLLRQNACFCGGDMDITSAPGAGTTVRACFERDHIDRPPLGDMVETLVSLIALNPKIDFSYIHELDEDRFEFTTTEVRERLEEVEINSPEVLNWIGKYLRERIEDLRGGED